MGKFGRSNGTVLSRWAKDERGKIYGRWTVIEFARSDSRGIHWVCRCECGTIASVWGADLRHGSSRSCGCGRNRSHGMHESQEYATWEAMKQRCYNKNHNAYRYYGGRGIVICKRWLQSFINFFDDMGPKPFPSASIDRLDNDGPYSPKNCRWATNLEQGQNTSKTRMLTYNGETLCLREWARRIGIAHGTLHQRLKRGWSLEKSLATPAIEQYKRARHIT